MPEPAVFRNCLLVLQALRESEVGEKVKNEKSLHSLVENMVASFESSSLDDKAKVRPHIFSGLSRIISTAVDATLCKVTNFPRLFVGCVGLEKVVVALYQLVHLNEDDITTARKYMTIIVAVLESLKGTQNIDSLSSSTYETIATSCFKSFQSILLIYTQFKSLQSDTAKCLKGPQLAQMIQSSIFFSKHKAKTVALQSLQCLDAIVDYACDPQEWRNYIPGSFSGLYSTCVAEYKRLRLTVDVVDSPNICPRSVGVCFLVRQRLTGTSSSTGLHF